MAAALSNGNFPAEHILYTPERIPDLFRNAKKGDVFIFDEGVLFLFSRESMTGQNKLIVKLLALMRQLNLIVLVAIPSFFVIEGYIRSHRLHGVFDIMKRGKIKCYNQKYLKILSKEGARYQDLNKVRIPIDGFFKTWNSAQFPLNIDEDEYKRLKKEHFDSFLTELDDAFQAMQKPKESDWVAMQDVVKQLPVCDKTIRRMIKDGELNGKQIGKLWFVKKESLEAYLKDTSKPPEPTPQDKLAESMKALRGGGK